ncbi:unnamed protein product [Rotaria sp. Silwood2]|nr:unnamed protein product [Rotaria sp. Silwood2]
MVDMDTRQYVSIFSYTKNHTLKYCAEEEIRLTHEFIHDEIEAINHSLPLLSLKLVTQIQKNQRQLIEQFTYDNISDSIEECDDNDDSFRHDPINETAHEVAQYY